MELRSRRLGGTGRAGRRLFAGGTVVGLLVQIALTGAHDRRVGTLAEPEAPDSRLRAPDGA
jgi:hypothetical protein